jgi:hypothetical protein
MTFIWGFTNLAFVNEVRYASFPHGAYIAHQPHRYVDGKQHGLLHSSLYPLIVIFLHRSPLLLIVACFAITSSNTSSSAQSLKNPLRAFSTDRTTFHDQLFTALRHPAPNSKRARLKNTV